MLKLIFLLLLSPTTNIDKAHTIYHLLQVEERDITAAIVRYESGHLKCYQSKIVCAQKFGNLFGFRYRNKYLKFTSYAESVKYYRRWQARKWRKYKKSHPHKNYYDFLRHVGYCDKMTNYIRVIKQIQKM